MSESAIPQTGEERRREQNRSTEALQAQSKPAPVGPLQTEKGNTVIDETVVAKIAGIATREVAGVYAMGNAARRAFNSLTERIPGSQTNVSGGISVEKGERQTAIDATIIIDYGASVVDVANAIRRNVIQSVEQSTGLEVVEVNIAVSDVHLPDDDAPSGSNSATGGSAELA
ncbi:MULTISPECIES: Asp23/Gls24 family envelope stress response protein [Actinomycetes]|uniref:Asp23/Gls24 family envelope stress response protein n=1 Tax=Actinomycetes TaxID=1760 RepID=UPI0011AA867D|nr:MULTISPECIES: Asp23/Gls24 family envelope stress response protein [Actinomycetes]MDA4829675.1 Asp23/Gls24 family envelope stress response protein [Kocuria rhizophila]